MRTLLALALLIPCLARVEGQAPQSGRPSFSSRSDLVVLHVSVVDSKGRPVSGLTRDAFRVLEDGVPQQVSFFDQEDSPATVGFVIDGSSSMQRKREAVIAGGMAFAEETHPEDEIFTVHFNERVWFGLPEGHRFTSDASEFRAALLKSTARGQTAVFDAVAAGLEHIAHGASQKKALVVVSDGGDNASRRSFKEVVAAAERSDALIYTICLTDEYDEDADPEKLERLADATGGEAFEPRKVRDVTKILRDIAHDLHSGYTIGYAPSASAKRGWRAVKVEASSGDHGKLIARARAGYVGVD